MKPPKTKASRCKPRYESSLKYIARKGGVTQVADRKEINVEPQVPKSPAIPIITMRLVGLILPPL